jgi:hypothetical protein
MNHESTRMNTDNYISHPRSSVFIRGSHQRSVERDDA